MELPKSTTLQSIDKVKVIQAMLAGAIGAIAVDLIWRFSKPKQK